MKRDYTKERKKKQKCSFTTLEQMNTQNITMDIKHQQTLYVYR